MAEIGQVTKVGVGTRARWRWTGETWMVDLVIRHPVPAGEQELALIENIPMTPEAAEELAAELTDGPPAT